VRRRLRLIATLHDPAVDKGAEGAGCGRDRGAGGSELVQEKVDIIVVASTAGAPPATWKRSSRAPSRPTCPWSGRRSSIS
jgi:hypothetical protein